MNYLLIYVNFIDQIIINHDKHQVQCDIFLKSFVPKVVPQPWMPPLAWRSISQTRRSVFMDHKKFSVLGQGKISTWNWVSLNQWKGDTWQCVTDSRSLKHCSRGWWDAIWIQRSQALFQGIRLQVAEFWLYPSFSKLKRWRQQTSSRYVYLTKGRMS